MQLWQERWASLQISCGYGIAPDLDPKSGPKSVRGTRNVGDPKCTDELGPDFRAYMTHSGGYNIYMHEK